MKNVFVLCFLNLTMKASLNKYFNSELVSVHIATILLTLVTPSNSVNFVCIFSPVFLIVPQFVFILQNLDMCPQVCLHGYHSAYDHKSVYIFNSLSMQTLVFLHVQQSGFIFTSPSQCLLFCLHFHQFISVFNSLSTC